MFVHTPESSYIATEEERWTSVSTLEKIFQVGKVLTYFLGSLLFLIGSILYYPSMATKWTMAPVYGAWCFFSGCICFFLGTNGDLIDIIRYNHGTILRQIINIYNGMCYVGAAAIFQLGAVYFLPQYYAISPSIGCHAFIVGSAMFTWAAFVDLYFSVTTPIKGQTVVKAVCQWSTLVSLGCIMGAIYFIIGSYFYLPQFIAVAPNASQDAIASSTAYQTTSSHLFVVGSVCFIINALAQIPHMLYKLKTPMQLSIELKPSALYAQLI